MKLKSVALLAALVCAPFSYADVLFDAKLSCKKRTMANGDRYIPPCSITQNSVEADYLEVANNNTEMNFKKALYKSYIEYSFVCESLRPVNLSYAVKEGNIVKQKGLIGASRQHQIQSTTFTHDYAKASFVLDGIQGMYGFQAMKPGCKMQTETFVAYPEPHFFALMFDSQKKIDAQLEAILDKAQTTVDYIQIIDSIEMAKLFLMRFFSEADEITQKGIMQMIFELETSRRTLENQCGAGSSSQSCVAGLKDVRDIIEEKSRINSDNLKAIRDQLDSQIAWLRTQSTQLGGDLKELEELYQKVNNYLSH
ncbi:hypothetical protein [Algicola sagamiensis]|uniref:hypothetical protein n=1 Tax=Algicola sagamiensis TaxID=163869 RepID=UPI00037A9E3D|nr:hypothetical protein [Algicola sagamiensis]